MQCKKCKGKFEPPENINLTNCPFCQELLQDTINYVPHSYEDRILKIIEDKGELIYTKKEFIGLIMDFFPNDDFGRLLISIISKKGALYIYNLKEFRENELQNKYNQVVDLIAKETFISKDVITPAVNLLCFGLGLKIQNQILNQVQNQNQVQVQNQNQTVQPTQATNIQSNSQNFISKDGILIKYLGKDSIISIPNDITSISRSSFKDYTNLKEVTIPESVKFIGDSAFEGCTSLTNIIIPTSIKEIGGGMFYGCTSLNQIVIPNSIKEIGYSSFKDCTNLTQISFPNSVTTISGRAFENCSKLTYVIIPNSVTEIGYNVFLNTTWFTSLREKFNVVGAGILLKYVGNDNKIIIPNTVNSIYDSVFINCSTITEVTIPNSVTIIGDNAFKNCTNLKEVTIPNSVTKIGNNAFEGCINLSKINIPASVVDIGKSAFLGCEVLPEDVNKKIASTNPNPFDLW